jgi:hypothetical protein
MKKTRMGRLKRSPTQKVVPARNTIVGTPKISAGLR